MATGNLLFNKSDTQEMPVVSARMETDRNLANGILKLFSDWGYFSSNFALSKRGEFVKG